MSTITISTADELLKRVYDPREIEMLVNLTHPALDKCARKGSAQLGGTGFYFAVRAEAAHGHAYISETGDLPAGRQSTVRQAVVSPTVHAGVVQLSGLSRAVSSGNAMAFSNTFDENVQSTLQAMSAYKEGALFRDGSGLLTRFNGNPGSTGALTVDDPAFLREGMYVDLIDDTGTTRHNTDIKVKEVDWVNKTVTFSTAIATANPDNGRIFIADSQAATGALQSLEPVGLEGALLDSGTYLGISRSTYPNWQANVLTASSFFDEDILLRARTRITQESGVNLQAMARSFGVLCHPSQVDVLFKLAIPRVRYASAAAPDLGNSDNVKFGGIEFITSYQCPMDKAYLGDWQYNQSLYTPGGELHIDSEHNGSQLKWVSTKDVGLVYMKEYCAFANRKPVCFARITSLTEPSR